MPEDTGKTPDLRALERQLALATERHARVDALNDLAWALQPSDPERCRALCDEAAQLAAGGDAAPYEAGLAYSRLIGSILEWDRSNYPAALALALDALDYFDQHGSLARRAQATGHLAGIHFVLGDYARALELGFGAVKLAEESGDRILLADLLNDTGYMCLLDERLPDALPQLMKSLAIHREMGSRYGEAQVLDSLGKAHYLMGDYTQALEYEFKSLAINRQVDYPRAEIEALNNIGKIYAAQHDDQRALAFFEQSLALARERSAPQLEATSLLDLGRAQTDRGELPQAITTLHEAQAVAEAITSKLLLFDIHLALAAAYEQAGDVAAALDHFKQFHHVKEQVFYDKGEKILRSLQMLSEVERARREAEIYQTKNAELQREIEEREKLIAELDAFAHTVAHDLKNPLMVITGYSEMLYDELLASGLTNQAENAQHVMNMGYKTSRIVDELLTLSSVRRQAVTPRPLDMAAIVAEAENRLDQLILDCGGQISTPDHWPVALGYAPWIEEVWANYLSNALAYGGTPPRITLGADPEGTWVRFWVRDNGDGIPQHLLPVLFTEFTRLEPQHAEGHGLGLSIVRRIIVKLDGTVGVESTGRPGQGSTFYFTLPAAPE